MHGRPSLLLLRVWRLCEVKAQTPRSVRPVRWRQDADDHPRRRHHRSRHHGVGSIRHCHSKIPRCPTPVGLLRHHPRQPHSDAIDSGRSRFGVAAGCTGNPLGADTVPDRVGIVPITGGRPLLLALRVCRPRPLASLYRRYYHRNGLLRVQGQEEAGRSIGFHPVRRLRRPLRLLVPGLLGRTAHSWRPLADRLPPRGAPPHTPLAATD